MIAAALFVGFTFFLVWGWMESDSQIRRWGWLCGLALVAGAALGAW